MPFAIIAEWIAKPGEETAVLNALSQLTEPSRAEPGNLQYHPHRDPEDPRRFVIYEQYQDEDAFSAHMASTHFAEHGLNDAVPRLESRRRTVYEPVTPE